MSKVKGIEKLISDYHTVPIMDLYYLAMKFHGVRDKDTEKGRATWNLIDNKSLFHITFGTSEDGSPYEICDNKKIIFDGRELPFRIDFVERMPVKEGRYYYFRHPDYLTPSLDDKLILNLNFKRQCFSCKFCQYHLYKHKQDISEKEGFNMITFNGNVNTFSDVDEIAVVTGCVGSSKKIAEHIERIIELSTEKGFRGKLFYMGSELNDKKDLERVVKVVQKNKLEGFRIAYTVEMFSDRERLMIGKKALQDLNDVYKSLKQIKEQGISELEYTYIPGLDSLDNLKKGAEMLADVAKPHICIFRPWRKGQRLEQLNPEYANAGPAALVEMRIFYEELYKGPILGNNLANLWPFPLDRIDKRWTHGKIVGKTPNNRYWKGLEDPRYDKCGIKQGQEK